MTALDIATQAQAQAAPPGGGADGPSQLVSFLIEDRIYGVDARTVREIRRWQPVAALPGQPHHMLGVLDIRGEATPIHDLRACFGEGATEPSAANVVVVVTLDGASLGLLVDAVSDIVDLARGEIRPAPSSLGAETSACVAGLIPRDDKMIALIDVARLF